ncbi:ABC transporter substrate-binding protein [Nonomuraea soli]|uniref:Peptide/nickel transport system substrate-binding protein n=1 Tax=Nonomuraea soli TaxID=1032476 RepID=A0A7W0CM84_9ACTN|nr:ABC transporter substrate-binding protein [Nonomuraea soli]MBA2893555.1 peptide/nickel transport system substrate-binding protein [Nonomuraea soli]
MKARLVALVLALLMAGCSAAPTVEPQRRPTARTPAFVYVENVDVISDWDPATAYSNEIVAFQNIYETLTLWNPVSKKAAPRLATSWKASTDGKTWSFKLRPGVRFHTGRALDAAAVKEAVERTMSSNGEPGYIWGPVSSVVVDDPLTVTFVLKYAVPFDLVVASTYAAYIYDPAGIDPAGKKDGGTGPYTVSTWTKGAADELVLTAFDGYWGGWERPHYRKITFRVVPSTQDQWTGLLTGEVTFVPRINRFRYGRAARMGGLRTSRAPSYQVLTLLFNTRLGPLTDVRIRKALQRAIDYSGLTRKLAGAVTPASGIIPEGLPGHVKRRAPRQNLQAATRLLTAAGYGPGGRPLTLSLTYAEGDEDQQQLVTSLRRTMRALNVTLDARAMPWLEQWEQGKQGGQDIFVMYWWPDYADAYSYFGPVFRSADPPVFNLTYLQDPQIDALIDSLPELTAVDAASAERAYAELTRLLLDVKAVAVVPWVVTYNRSYAAGVQGYHDNPAYPDVVFVYDLRPSA